MDSRGRVRGADQKGTGLGAVATLPYPQLGFQWLLDSTKSRVDAQQDKSKVDHLLVLTHGYLGIYSMPYIL